MDHFPVIVLSALAAQVILCVTPVRAHDTGFGHSRRTIFFSRTGAGILIEYRIVMNPDEALIEMTHIDSNRDGRIERAERDRFLGMKARQLAKRFRIQTEAGTRLEASPTGFKLGNAFTQTFCFVVTTRANKLFFDDDNFLHKPGLILIRHGKGLKLRLTRDVNLFHAERVSVYIEREQ